MLPITSLNGDQKRYPTKIGNHNQYQIVPSVSEQKSQNWIQYRILESPRVGSPVELFHKNHPAKVSD